MLSGGWLIEYMVARHGARPRFEVQSEMGGMAAGVMPIGPDPLRQKTGGRVPSGVCKILGARRISVWISARRAGANPAARQDTEEEGDPIRGDRQADGFPHAEAGSAAVRPSSGAGVDGVWPYIRHTDAFCPLLDSAPRWVTFRCRFPFFHFDARGHQHGVQRIEI